MKTGQVTYAVRDTHIDDREIHEGDIMGIGDDGILSVGPSVEGSVKEMLEIMADEDTELISLSIGGGMCQKMRSVWRRRSQICIRMPMWICTAADSRSITMYCR